ncbi:7735_t:CDS:2, partial [Acaulospora morrowiae]
RTPLPSQNGTPSLQTPLQPMMDPGFIQNAPPNFCYWHPQPILVPQYGTAATPQSYVPASVNRAQPTQTASVGGAAAMMPLDQQQYVEVIWNPVPQHHYASTPAQYYSPNSSGTMALQYQQISQQQFFRNTEDQYQ